MTRQFAAESHDGYCLRLDTPAEVWTRPDQFELLCSFAGTMAEDLFAEGRLSGVCLNGGPLLETRGQRDVEAFLDELARLEPVAGGGSDSSNRPQGGWGQPPLPVPTKTSNVITFAPEGARGVAAYVDGHPTASA